MNRTVIKNFAVWARKKLMAEVESRWERLGITKDGIVPMTVDFGEGIICSDREKEDILRSRDVLTHILNKDSDHKTAFHNLVEKAACDWFLRFITIRFMEVNGYLPVPDRIFSFDSLQGKDNIGVAFSEMVMVQLKQLHKTFPMFFEMAEYDIAPLVPISCHDPDNVVIRFQRDIPEAYFDVTKDGRVEIIGWLYQYYNSEAKDEAFSLLKQNVKITKDRIPAVTQLFTPRWIVRYLVENSLGRLWLEHKKNDELRSRWNYYVEQAEDIRGHQKKREDLLSGLSLKDLRFIDPCMGSGNILVYAFDLLMDIYKACGYEEKDAAFLILEHNLYGLDLDPRAAGLTRFSLMMKARRYDSDIFKKIHCLPFYAIENSNNISREFSSLGKGMTKEERIFGEQQLHRLLDSMIDAEEYGSILPMEDLDWDLLRCYTAGDPQLLRIVEIGSILSGKYHAVVTNPPYMGSAGMDQKLFRYVKAHYPDSKTDLFSVFIERCSRFTLEGGCYAMITQPSFLFLSSFEKLRRKLLEQDTFLSLLHLGRGIFGVDFGSVAFVLRRSPVCGYKGWYFRLHQRNFQYIHPDDIENIFLRALSDRNFHFDFSGYDSREGISFDKCSRDGLKICFEKDQRDFLKLPGIPLGYWVSDEMLNVFVKGTPLGEIADSRQGLATTDNKKYLRCWFEVAWSTITFDMSSTAEAKFSGGKWFPYNKGGEYRKWYGNQEHIVNYENDGEEIKTDVMRKYPYLKTPEFVVKNTEFYFRSCFSWSLISSGAAAFRNMPQGFLFDVAGMSCFSREHQWYLLGLCNSVVASKILEIIAPTINYQCGDIAKIPVFFGEEYTVEKLVKENIKLAKEDWDSFETSWDFEKHPLLPNLETNREVVFIETNSGCGCYTISSSRLADCFNAWEQECEYRFHRLKANEEKLNRIFIDIYGLQDELTPNVEDKDITVRKADLRRDIKSLISYAVGCMFGRYSLDATGLSYAGGEWDAGKYLTFIPNADNGIPVTDEEYFEDDIVGLFCSWLKRVYGAEMLEENLDFIANALGNRGKTSREVIRNYFLKDFMKDHIKCYQKRPIYWLFDSGKAKGFKALVYMHRWSEDTIPHLRNGLLSPLRSAYKKDLEAEKLKLSFKERNVVNGAKRHIEKLEKKIRETDIYDEKLVRLESSPISIDFDDGVKSNYEKVQTDKTGEFLDVLMKI